MGQFESMNHKLKREIQVLEDQLYVSRTITIDHDDFKLLNSELDTQKKKLKDKMNEAKGRFEEAYKINSEMKKFLNQKGALLDQELLLN